MESNLPRTVVSSICSMMFHVKMHQDSTRIQIIQFSNSINSAISALLFESVSSNGRPGDAKLTCDKSSVSAADMGTVDR